MACTNVPRLLVDRPVAPDSPLPHGLIDTSTVVENMNPHGIHGLEYVALCDPAVKPYPVGDCPDDARPPKESDRSQSLVRADAFALYAAEACPATASALATARTALVDRFQAGEQHALEAVVYNGWAGARPFLRDPEADIVVQEPVPLGTAIGLLEHRLATLGYPATIHLPRWMATQTPGVVRESGQLITNPDDEDILTGAGLFTRLGSRLVFGSGYDGAPPVGVDDDGNTWLYATTPVTVSRSELIYPADASSGAFNPATNTTFALVERLYVVDWPCQVVAVPTTVPNPGPLFPIPPLAPQILVDPLSGPAPLEVSVTVDNYGQGPVTIDFGDGTEPVTAEDGETVTHVYATPGPYTITASSNANPLLTATQHVQVTAPTIPSPTNLSATGGDTQVELEWEWEGEDDPDAFEVQYRINGDEWTSAPDVNGDARTTTITGLEPDTTYQVRVRARVGTFTSPPAVATATTDPAPELASPQNVAATDITTTSATITWDWEAGDGPAVEEFVVQANGVDLVVGDPDARTTPLTGLEAGTVYELTVTARAGQEEAPSAPAEFSTLPLAALSAPTDVTTSNITTTSVDAAWEWAQGDGPAVESFTLTAGDTTVTVDDPAARTGSLEELDPGTEYELTVTAHAGEEEAESDPAEFSTLPLPVAAPTGVTATEASPESLDVAWEWEQGDGADATGFEVSHRTPPGEGDWSTPQPVGAEDRTLTVDGLEPGTEYEVRVIALAGEVSSDPATATGTTGTLGPLEAPTGLSGSSDSSTAFTLTWSWDQGDGPDVDSFEVTYATTPGGDEQTQPEAADARTATVTGLEEGGVYAVTVTAIAGQERATSTTYTISLPNRIEAATDVAVNNATPTSLEVTWAWTAGFGPPATSFTVRHRTPAGSGDWSEPVTTPAAARSAELQDLEPETEYEVEVVAYANSEASEPATATGSTTTEP